MRLTETEAHAALHQQHSDTYKSINGFRPRRDMSGLTCDEIYAEIQEMEADIAADAGVRPTSGEGWAFDGEDREYFDDDEDFDRSWFTVTTGEAGEDY
jgi:hypothetical protein